MKKLYLTLCIGLFVGLYSQTVVLPSGLTGVTSENYVFSRTYLEATTTSNTTTKQIQSVTYFDGLGRAKQVINVKASPTGKDIVNFIEYDGFGRQTKDYLPIPQTGTQNGSIYPPLSNAATIYGSEKIYAEKILEASPLSRIQQQIQVGNDWATHPVHFDYDTNSGSEVKKYTTTTTWSNNATTSTITISGTYLAKQLYKNSVTDEDGNISIEFKNGEGQTLLVRKNDGSQNVDTYYVYNEYNQLAFVVPPLAAAKIALLPADLNDLCYQYRYDGRNRLVEKKLPGKGWEFMVYDKQDRIALTKDSQNSWLFTKYDQFSRVVYTGIYNNGGSRSTLQSTLNNLSGIVAPNNETRNSSGFNINGMQTYYTNTAFPNGNLTLLSINYYDTYPTGSPTIPGTVLMQAVLPQNAQTSAISTKSLPTASYVKNIEDDNWTKNYTWYDTKGRPIGSHSINHLGGFTKTESELDFAGVVQQSNTTHKRLSGDAETLVHEEFTYDEQNRLKLHKHQVNSQPMIVLAENTYNELSQLSEKKVGNNLQTIDYTYNIRGWMTGINPAAIANIGASNKLFGYQINYNSPIYEEVSPPKYNGNISEVTWTNSVNGIIKRYNYTYDAINRLSNAQFSNPALSLPHNGLNNETIDYDANGNILNLSRTAKSLVNGNAETIDILGYNYIGNKVININDSTGNLTGYEGGGNTITYDVNGNMTNMLDKNIQQIGYNFLNLPNAFSIDSNHKIQLFLYRADGTKLRKIFNSIDDSNGQLFSTISEYIDGFHYLQTQGIAHIGNDPLEFAYEQESFLRELRIRPTPKLQFFPTAEGFYDYEKNEYIYQYKDHLGNVRLSYKNNNNVPEITDQNDFYPFGMNIPREEKSIIGAGSLYNYKYNGKELQETGMYAMDWRHYMSDIGRFVVQDPLSGNIPGVTPYRFAFNNPIYFSDPTGLIEEGVNGFAYCPTCPKTEEFKPYIDDKNNVYVYNPETNTAALKVTPIEEVVVTGKKSDSNAPVYLGYFNDGVGETGGWLSKNNKGGSIGIWTTPIKGRDFDGIKYNKLNVKYYKDGWKWSKSVKTYGVGNYLKKGSIIGSAVLGAIEIGNGVADDYNDYETKGETYGKNTVKATATVVTSTAVGWAAGAATGAVIGSFIPIPGVGTVVGFIVGAGVGYVAGELAADAVEKAYE